MQNILLLYIMSKTRHNLYLDKGDWQYLTDNMEIVQKIITTKPRNTTQVFYDYCKEVIQAVEEYKERQQTANTQTQTTEQETTGNQEKQIYIKALSKTHPPALLNLKNISELQRMYAQAQNQNPKTSQPTQENYTEEQLHTFKDYLTGIYGMQAIGQKTEKEIVELYKKHATQAKHTP